MNLRKLMHKYKLKKYKRNQINKELLYSMIYLVLT